MQIGRVGPALLDLARRERIPVHDVAVDCVLHHSERENLTESEGE